MCTAGTESRSAALELDTMLLSLLGNSGCKAVLKCLALQRARALGGMLADELGIKAVMRHLLMVIGFFFFFLKL